MKSLTVPFVASDKTGIFSRHHWPVSWITLDGVGEPPYVLGFRLIVEQAQTGVVRAQVTADERYELYLDGELVARGPERGLPDYWYYTTIDLPLTAGRHVVFAKVWALGDRAPQAQLSVRPGFLLAVEDGAGSADRNWSTGLATWEVKRLDGYSWFDHPDIGFDGFTGKKLCLDGNRYPWGIEQGKGEDWRPAVVNSKASVFHPTDLKPTRLLVPGTLPQMLRRPFTGGKVRFAESAGVGEDFNARCVVSSRNDPELAGAFQTLLEGKGALQVPPQSRCRAVIDLGTYVCAYPQMVASGGQGARVTVRWAEALFEHPGEGKGNRGVIDGRLFRGFADVFLLDGKKDRRYSTLWWEAGRFIELAIETGDQELTLHQWMLEETRYPLEMDSSFMASDERLQKLAPLLLRTLQVNAHETFMDCPYYEQLNYTGDTLFDCLVTYSITSDVSLARKSIELFDRSRLTMGLTQSRVPSRTRQVIPTFSLLWIAMVRNHAWWRGEPEFIRQILPGVRAVIDAHLLHVGDEGLLRSLRGWNFVDWMAEWKAGVPPGGEPGEISGPINWMFVYALQAAIELETFAGEPEMAARYRRWAACIAKATDAMFWNEERGLFADDREQRVFSEHSQCLAILSGWADDRHAACAAKNLVEAKGLIRCAYYFSHYLFETLRLTGQPDPLFQRLHDWYDLAAQGFVTTPETSEPSRSDCHAWGAHPLFHFYATILGIRPASMGFDEVEIRPLLGPLHAVSGRMIHPRGWIEVDLKKAGDRIEGTVVLPVGTRGEFRGPTRTQALIPGAQNVSA